MRHGNVYRLGDVVLAEIQFTDTFEVKTRPAVVLFEEYGNIVVAGITSNTEMNGIPLTKKEGAIKDSIIKINYIFTISENMIKKKLVALSQAKREFVVKELVQRLQFTK